MTLEEMLALDSGRELDAHIAVMVMGFKEVTIVGNHYFTDPIDTSLKEYSTDISAAWEVVKHLREEHGLRLHLELQNHSGCYIWLENDMGGNVTGCYEFESEIEGICKIALLAILPGEE